MSSRDWQFTLEVRAADAPEPDDAFEALRERWESGSASLRAEEASGRDWWGELGERLGAAEGTFLAEFEAHVNAQAERWGRDRFRLGFALGASGLLRALDD